MIILRQKMYLSQKLQDWAKKERMNRDWDEMERQEYANNLSKNARKADHQAHLAFDKNAAIEAAPLTEAERVANNGKGMKGIYNRNYIINKATPDEGAYSSSLNSTKRRVKDGAGKLYIKMRELKGLLKDQKDLLAHENKIYVDPKYKNINQDQTNRKGLSYSYGKNPENKSIKNSDLSKEEKRNKFRENIASHTSERHASTARRVRNSIDQLNDVISENEQDLNDIKQDLEDNKGIRKDMANKDYLIGGVNGDNEHTSTYYHEDAHNQLEKKRKELGIKSGNVDLDKLVDNDGLGSANYMYKYGSEFEYDPDLDDIVDKRDIKGGNESIKSMNQKLQQSHINYMNNVVKEEQDASALAIKNAHLDPEVSHELLGRMHNELESAGNTYKTQAQYRGHAKEIARKAGAINTNTRISDKRLALMEKRENNLIDKALNEGKSFKDTAKIIKEFREKHGRMGGFNNSNPTHYLEKLRGIVKMRK